MFQSEIAAKVQDLGGVHKYDLTPDVTHLVVGEYDTPKYRHVARERPDIKAMDIAWVEAVMDLWKKDDEIDFAKLEREYQLKTFETRGTEMGTQSTSVGEREALLICLTGFGDQRDEIAESIISNGGKYTGDLTRKCTHLVVNTPEGKKFNAAKSWNVRTVTFDWLTQSIARGMILEETKFDPLLPPEEQGVGAWIKEDRRRQSLGKRSRSEVITRGEEGQGMRKLRRTATAKLNTQRDNIWGDILGRTASREYSFAQENQQQPQEKQPKQDETVQQEPVAEPRGTYSQCIFCIHGFNRQKTSVLREIITSLDGRVVSLEELTNDPSPNATIKARFLIVPQTSQPDTHPTITNDDIHVVTEFFIERCLHTKKFLFPLGDLTLGRPFPTFPIPGFEDLTICSAAFTGIELSQVARAVIQLGANFEEQFRPSTTVLVCRALEHIRKEKLKLALRWGVPVVSADWLWECISTGHLVPFTDFAFPGLDGRKHEESQPVLTATKPAPTDPEGGDRLSKPTRSESVGNTAARGEKSTDVTKSKRTIVTEESTVSADFMTAPTRPVQDQDAALTELSSASLNKSPSPTKSISIARSKSAPSNANTTTSEDSTPRPPSRRAQSEQEDDAEAQRRAAKALEREVLSSKITSLLDNTAQDTPQEAAPRPRKRQILGRAISNASSAADNSAAQPSAGTDEAERGKEPPNTQIVYEDPEAQERKAELLSRMMGGSGETVKTSVKTSRGKVSVGGGNRTLRRR